METSGDSVGPPAQQKKSQRKLRSACDSCHHTKVKCTGGNPCQTCASLDLECVYSVSNRTGRPRGTKNKKTIERLNREKALAEAQKAEAERAEAYRNLEASMMHQMESSQIPLPATTNSLPQECLQSPAEAMEFGTGFSQLNDLCPLTMPPGGDSAMAMPDLAWGQAPETESMAWLPEGMPAHASQVVQSPMTDIFDLSCTSTVNMIPSAWTSPPTPQSFYLTPESSRRGTISQPTSEYQAQTGQKFRGASPPYSNGESHSVNQLESPCRSDFHEVMAAGNVPCHCLQSQADVLCRFKKCASEANPRMDVLLIYAKQGITTWRSLLQCDSCRRSKDHEALLLCSMGIRTFMRSLQATDLDTLHEESGGASPVSGQADLHLRTASIDSGLGGIPMSRAPSAQSQVMDTDSDSLQGHRMGMYEITGTDQAIVTKVLLGRALAQVKEILAGLRQQIEWRQVKSTGGAGVNGTHAELVRNQRLPQQSKQQGSLSSLGHPDDCIDDSHMQEVAGFGGASWAEAASRASGTDLDDAVHLLGLLRNLEGDVQNFRRKLKGWILAHGAS